MRRTKWTILFCVMLLVSAAQFFNPACGKYAKKVSVGSVEISLVAKGKPSQLLEGKKLNRYLHECRLWGYSPGDSIKVNITKIVFDTYEHYPQMRKENGLEVGVRSEEGESGGVKIYYSRTEGYPFGATAYVLSESTIVAGSCENMFWDCKSLRIVEFNNFETENVTNMRNMFRGCESLQTLDLSGFDTSAVSDMRNMFRDCAQLKTIYASEKWSIESVKEKGESMFWGCYNLVGGNGTKYRSSRVSAVYARIDGEKEGYFTKK